MRETRRERGRSFFSLQESSRERETARQRERERLSRNGKRANAESSLIGERAKERERKEEGKRKRAVGRRQVQALPAEGGSD